MAKGSAAMPLSAALNMRAPAYGGLGLGKGDAVRFRFFLARLRTWYTRPPGATRACRGMNGSIAQPKPPVKTSWVPFYASKGFSSKKCT